MSGYNWLLSATVLLPKLLNFQHCDWLLFATHAAYDSSKIKKHKGDLKKGKIATKLTKYALSLSLAKDKMPALLAVKKLKLYIESWRFLQLPFQFSSIFDSKNNSCLKFIQDSSHSNAICMSSQDFDYFGKSQSAKEFSPEYFSLPIQNVKFREIERFSLQQN